MFFLKKIEFHLIITKLNYLFLGETPEVENLKRLFNQKDDLVSARKNDLEQKLMSAKTKLEHENISVQVSSSHNNRGNGKIVFSSKIVFLSTGKIVFSK